MAVLSSHSLVAVLWSLTLLAVMFTVGRFAIHWHRRKRVQWDDVFNGFAAVFLLAFAGTYQRFGPLEYDLELHELGLLDERPALNPQEHQTARQYDVANIIIFWCVIYSVKASFLALYWLVFKHSRPFRIVWGVIVLYTVVSFGVSFMIPFWRCKSPRRYLSVGCKSEKYFVRNMLTIWCVLDLVGDVLLMALPMAMLRKLLVRTSQKVELSILFGLVLFNIIFEILRTVYSLHLQNLPDQNTLWVFLHATSAVIICALPCYRGLISRNRYGSTTSSCTCATGKGSSVPSSYNMSNNSSKFHGDSG